MVVHMHHHHPPFLRFGGKIFSPAIALALTYKDF